MSKGGPTDWYAPNQQAVGSSPAAAEHTKASAKTASSTEPQTAPKAEKPADTFDPADYTVAEVLDYIAANPDQEKAVLRAERKGKNRTGITGG